MHIEPEREALALLPTALHRSDRLSEAWGGPRIWFKRDDLTGFGASGNKVRKLEFHVAAAHRAGADTLVTCGAAQSNHCRATAVVAAATGFSCVLFLRTPDGRPAKPEGNLLLDLLAGAEVRFVDPDWYERRDENMARESAVLAADGASTWVIPEGGSDALGFHGYVNAGNEAAEQIAVAGIGAPIHWHAASSGGTTAGLAASRKLPGRIVAVSVSDPADALLARIERIWSDAGLVGEERPDASRVELRDDFIGLGYGLATPAELDVQVRATSMTGLIFDPTYTGKALYALHSEIAAGRLGPDDDVVFWHTGGGFAAFAFDYGDALTR